MLISDTKFSWKPVTIRVPQGETLGSVLFNILINDPDDGAVCTLSNSGDDTKLGGWGGNCGYERGLCSQRDLDRLKR